MDWSDIIHRDAYQAGAIAARGWEWWHDPGPIALMQQVGLVKGTPAYEEFLRGWNDEIKEAGIEELQRLYKEQEESLQKAERRGDPTNW